ncbi:MAG: AMP-binding protein [Planctomycetaceae bacterium]|nr:AMP-binding protein [Planctomycetaceae bacterium]
MNITVEELVERGLSQTQADSWMILLQSISIISDELERWNTIVTQLLRPEIPFAVHELLYERNYKEHRLRQLPCPGWIPSEDDIHRANLTGWMNELGLFSYEEMHAWSVANREEFTEKLTTALSIQFDSQPTQYCDVSAGVENVRWYRNASLNMVESCFQADDEAVAIIAGDAENQLEEITYAQLKSATARVANGLVELGLKPGDRVAVSMPMTVDSVATFLGIIAAGCAVVTIADSFSAEEMAVRLKITQPKCMFIQDVVVRGGKRLPLYEKITSQENMQAIVLGADGTPSINLRSGDLTWEQFLSADTTLHCVARNPDDETTILFSSGTTGNPKAIPWDHTTPVKAAGDAYLHHDIHSGDILCWPTNLGWMMGPWLVYAALINRGTIALSQTVPTSRLFCEFVQQVGVTMLGLVPSIVSAWRKQDQIANLDWTFLRLFSSTGECSNPNDMLWLMSRAGYRPVIEYCGGTETGGGYVTGVMIKPSVPGLFSAKAMGFPWQLRSESGEETSLGEVFFEPPVIGLSTRLLNRDHHEVYFAGIETSLNQPVLRRHGDQLEELPGGYYRAHGRIDDAMNLGGIKVSSVQIEELLGKHPAVQELAAISVPPPQGGPELLVIVVVLYKERDQHILKNEFQQIIKTELNPLFKIEDVKTIDHLPRTASNKVMRRKLRDSYLENRSK